MYLMLYVWMLIVAIKVSYNRNSLAQSLLLLLLSYHNRLRMISEVLELRVEGGQVSHSWCMCVVSHGYGGLGGGRDEGD